MCNIYPRYMTRARRGASRSKAEMQFYDACRTQLDNRWTVIYDVRWHAPEIGKAGHGQADFIVAHEDLGALVLEVKGAGLERVPHTREWLQVNHEGKYPIDPIKQVQNSMHALLAGLRRRNNLPDGHLGLFHAVAFPQARTAGSEWTIEMPSELTIGREHMPNLEARLREIFAYHHRRSNNETYSVGARLIEEILAITNSRVEYVYSLSAKVDEDEQELIELTTEQIRLLDCFRKNKRVLIDGCAGSGKTLLAVEKARQLAKSGKRTLLTCFNAPLERFLREATAGIENLDVVRFHQLCRHQDDHFNPILPVLGASISRDDDPNFVLVLMEAAKKNPEIKYDAIIIDEAQDFRSEWGIALEACLRNDESLLYVFKDSGQNLYGIRHQYAPVDMCHFSLQRNIRNSQAIGQYVRRHYLGADDVPMVLAGPAGRDVAVHVYQSEQQLIAEVSEVITKWIDEEHVSPKDIVVLTPRKIDRSALFNLKLPNAFVNTRTTTERGILISSINRFKGMESNFVVVVELDNEFSQRPEHHQSTHCYAAFSRAKHHLVVFSSPECASLV